MGDLQSSLPPTLHIEVSSLYAFVVSKVHPFGEVFFEVRPHWLVSGPALQNRHRRGESTHGGGRMGLFDVKPSKQIIFHSSYQYKSHMWNTSHTDRFFTRLS